LISALVRFALSEMLMWAHFRCRLPVLSLATAEQRVILTFDRHYGELIFRHG